MFANKFIVILFDLGYLCLKLKKNHEAFVQEEVEYTTLTNYPVLIEEAVTSGTIHQDDVEKLLEWRNQLS